MAREIIPTLRLRLPRLLAGLVLIFVSACAAPTKTEVESELTSEPFRTTQEATVLFPTYREQPEEGKADFMRCLKRELEKEVSHRVKIVETATFQDSLFPWFEPQYAPAKIDDLNALLSRRFVRERIASLGIRYLITLTTNSTSNGFPGMFCGGGYGGSAGCLGLAWENKNYKVDAVIFDLLKEKQSGEVSVNSSGKSIGFAFIVPIVFVAYTELDACKALAVELGQIIIGNSDISQ
jgi:hypothetical protein